MKKNVVVTLFLAFMSWHPATWAQMEPGRISHHLLRAVVKIEIPPPPGRPDRKRTGTGFLVSHAIPHTSPPVRVSFLVTNKHLLGDWNLVDGKIGTYHRTIRVFFYRKRGTSGPSYEPVQIDLVDDAGSPRDILSLHPNPKIDIALIQLDAVRFISGDALDLATFETGDLVPFDQIAATTFTGLGDQVFALGYPNGITSLRNNYPIAKSAYLSSLPGTEFAVEVPLRNRRKERVKARLEGKILLLDGLVAGGNSGGPVLLPTELKTRRDSHTPYVRVATEPAKNLVLGIVSGGISSAGLTTVYSADYILELIDSQIKETESET